MQLFDAAPSLDGEPKLLDHHRHLVLGIDVRPRRHVQVVRVDLVEFLLRRRGGQDAVREQCQLTTRAQDRRDLLQRKLGLDPVEGLGEHDEIELSIRWLPLLKGRLLDTDTLRGRHTRHPFVRFDGEDIRAGFRQLRCCDAGSGADVQRTDTRIGDEFGEERLRIARTVAVVRIGGGAERLRAATVGVSGLSR
jgi:hypothetical protein